MFVKVSGLFVAACLLLNPTSSFAESISGFGDFSQFTYNQKASDIGSPPTIVPGAITITDGGGSEARSLFYNTPVGISSFHAWFTYKIPVGSGTVFDFDPSAAFVIQNSPQGVHAVGPDGLTFGYAGITNSAAISMQLVGSGATGGGRTGLFTGGNVSTSMSTSPVSFTLGNPIQVDLLYTGSKLTETLTDTVTLAKFSTSYLVNLLTPVGSSTAYVGFTASTDNGGFNPPQSQTISDFHYVTPVPEPATISLIGLGTLCLVAFYRKRG